MQPLVVWYPALRPGRQVESSLKRESPIKKNGSTHSGLIGLYLKIASPREGFSERAGGWVTRESGGQGKETQAYDWVVQNQAYLAYARRVNVKGPRNMFKTPDDPCSFPKDSGRLTSLQPDMAASLIPGHYVSIHQGVASPT